MIIYQDESLVAACKPSNLLTHRTPMNRGERDSLLNRLEDELEEKLYTLHRLDKSTSGVVLFAKNKDVAREISNQFASHTIQKSYLALVRGFLPAHGIQERVLRVDEHSPWKDAKTEYYNLKKVEMEVPVSRYTTSRYSLALLLPQTGRYHQLRKHMAQLRHYIIGDKRHGDVKHNKVFEHQHNLTGLFLHAHSLTFTHPKSGVRTTVSADLPDKWKELETLFSWKLSDIPDLIKDSGPQLID